MTGRVVCVSDKNESKNDIKWCVCEIRMRLRMTLSGVCVSDKNEIKSCVCEITMRFTSHNLY